MSGAARHYGLSGTTRRVANDNASGPDMLRLWTWRILIVWCAFWIIVGGMEVLHVISAWVR